MAFTPENITQEIETQANEDELQLPYTAEQIATIEQAGGVVDLMTGEITANTDVRNIIPTILGAKYARALENESNNRTSDGRFTNGNKWSSVGWETLINRRFNGDEEAAKTWLGKLGVWSYGQQSLNPYFRVKDCFLKHPGTPEEFMQNWDFDLNDVPELEF